MPPTTAPHTTAPPTITINPAACSGHGVCAELLPELVSLDEWGYPLLASRQVPSRLRRQARRAARDCPALAFLVQGA